MTTNSLKSEGKKTLILAYPIILAQLGHTLQGLVDSLMVGQVGAVELAASAFVGNVLSIPMVVIMGATTAISVMVSQAYGANDFKKCGAHLYTGFLNTVALISLIVGGLIILRGHLDVFKQPAEVNEISQTYYSYVAYSLVPMALFVSLRQFSEGLSMTKEPMLFLTAAVGVNIVLNWIFIFGNLGAPRMELEGAGLATLITRISVFISFALFLIFSKRYKRYQIPLSQFAIKIEEFKKMIKLGLPSATQYLFEVGAFSGAGIMAGWISTEALAAHQISLNIATVSFMVVLGLSFASSIRTGQTFGAGKYTQTRSVGVSALILGLGFMSLTGITFSLLRHWLPGFYVDDPAVISLAASMLIVVAVFQIFDGAQAVALGLLRGLSDVNLPTLITLISYWVWGLPFMYFITFKLEMGPLGIWIGLATALALSSVLLVTRYLKVTNHLLKTKEATNGP